MSKHIKQHKYIFSFWRLKIWGEITCLQNKVQFNVFKITSNPFSLVSPAISLIPLLKSLSHKTGLGNHLTIIKKKKISSKTNKSKIRLFQILVSNSNNDTTIQQVKITVWFIVCILPQSREAYNTFIDITNLKVVCMKA